MKTLVLAALLLTTLAPTLQPAQAEATDLRGLSSVLVGISINTDSPVLPGDEPVRTQVELRLRRMGIEVRKDDTKRPMFLVELSTAGSRGSAASALLVRTSITENVRVVRLGRAIDHS